MDDILGKKEIFLVEDKKFTDTNIFCQENPPNISLYFSEEIDPDEYLWKVKLLHMFIA